MCATCGCGAEEVRWSALADSHPHDDDQQRVDHDRQGHDGQPDHDGRQEHDHHHDHGMTAHTLALEQAVLAKNDHLAQTIKELAG